MAIQWFPGHMHKASMEIKRRLPEVDLVLEVIDARIPFSSANPLLADLCAHKPILRLFNKSDLADPEQTATWQRHYAQTPRVQSLTLQAVQDTRRAELVRLIREMVPNHAHQVQKIQAMVVGIPNVGKSTLINSLAGRRIAKTGDEPAVTQRQQRIILDEGIVLHDTPGVLWHNLENQPSAYRLALCGSIKDTAFEHLDIARFGLAFWLEAYPERLAARFRLPDACDDIDAVLASFAQQRGCLKKGAVADGDRMAKLLVSEFRSGLLGPMTLETPEMIAAEWENVLQNRAEKAAKKALRLAQKKTR